jgi:hypothetical protein
MQLLLAAPGWVDFARVLPFIIAFLVWVIGRFASQVPNKPPQRGPMPGKPVIRPQKPGPPGDSLQSEIDDFLRQAQAAREGRTTGKAGQASPSTAQSEAGKKSGRPDETQRKKQQPRRTVTRQTDRGVRRDESRPLSQTSLSKSTTESSSQQESQPRRESLAEHVAETLDSSKFARRATKLSNVQESLDAEFRQHMQRVFKHDLVDTAGTAAGSSTPSSGPAANLAATATGVAVAPVVTLSADRKVAADIAALLAGGKGIRDAVILTEILQRPEQRW